MIGHRPISTFTKHHPGANVGTQLRTGAIEAEQGQRGHGGRKPGKGMNLATSPQNECENRRRRPSRGLAHTPGTPIFALFRWTSERAASMADDRTSTPGCSAKPRRKWSLSGAPPPIERLPFSKKLSLNAKNPPSFAFEVGTGCSTLSITVGSNPLEAIIVLRAQHTLPPASA